MKRFAVCLFAFIGLLVFGVSAEAQLIERAEHLIRAAFSEAVADSLPSAEPVAAPTVTAEAAPTETAVAAADSVAAEGTVAAEGSVDTVVAEPEPKHTLPQNMLRVVLFVAVVLAQWFLVKLTNYLFRKLRRHIVRFKQQRLKPLIVRDYELLNRRQLGRIMMFLSNVVRYVVLLVQLMFSVPVLFAIFPQTEDLALKIFLYIVEPIKMVARSVVEYIPNLFIIVVIWFCIKYLIKGLRYLAGEIEHEKLRINGFYPDWAQPSFNIIRFLLYAFMIAMIYPYLPGSNSGVFQGISVFVGLIVSLGSSTV
ncbi:MAG: hypothetical protein K2K72_02465, partial [Duncaniella sp.]|nr:hypothetical protein [Duncaniella sp.]